MANQEKQMLPDERIKAFLASGQSQAAWCQEQGLQANQLGYWLRKYEARMSQSSGKRWVSMESESHSHSGVSLSIGNIVLDIEPGFVRQVLVSRDRRAERVSKTTPFNSDCQHFWRFLHSCVSVQIDELESHHLTYDHHHLPLALPNLFHTL